MRILTVDDQPGIAETLATVLAEYGHECTWAESGEAAIGLLSQGTFDAVISDYVMPGADGLDVVRFAKAAAPATRVILLSAFADTFYRREEREPEVDAVVSKPASGAQIQAILVRLSGRR